MSSFRGNRGANLAFECLQGTEVVTSVNVLACMQLFGSVGTLLDTWSDASQLGRQGSCLGGIHLRLIRRRSSR